MARTQKPLFGAGSPARPEHPFHQAAGTAAGRYYRDGILLVLLFSLFIVGCDQRQSAMSFTQTTNLDRILGQVGVTIPPSRVLSSHVSDERHTVYDVLFTPDAQTLAGLKVTHTVDLEADALPGVQSDLSTAFGMKTQVQEARFSRIDHNMPKVICEVTVVKTKDAQQYGILRVVDMR